MKKLVIAALAIASMAACTKSNVQYEQPGEISLQPVAQKATKAVTGTIYPENEMFNVWAWWVESGAGSSNYSVTAKDYIKEGTFKKKDNSWGGWDMEEGKVNPYYWPTTGSLFFAGYSPADAKVSGTFSYSLKDYTMTIVGYNQANDIKQTKDLMWFDVVNESYDKTASVNGVPVEFKHALSWLTFKFNLKDQQTAHNWKVTEVKLTGIETMANCTIQKGSDPDWEDLTILNQSTLSDEEKAEAKTIVIFDNDAGTEISYSRPDTWTNGDNTIQDFGGTKLELDGSNGVLIIPQSCAEAEAQLEISYLLKVPAGDNEYISQSKTLFLNAGTEDGTTWKPGKHYVYTITFGADEILINPTVADWTTTPVNVQVQ